MYKVVRTALPLLFIAAVYSGGPFYDVFGWGTDWPSWGTLLLIAGIANILCACIDRGYRISAIVLYLQLRRADKARKASAEASAGVPPQHPTDVQ